VRKGFIRKLNGIVGADHVSRHVEDLICYSYDGTPYRAHPEVVVHPGSTAEVAELLATAAEAGVKVVARGAGTGLSGGSVPLEGGMVLHLDRMNRLRRLDPLEMLAVVEPGMTNWDLRQAAEGQGLFYPPDPGSTKVCTLGGNVAENAGGPHGVKYGVTGDYVIGLEGVLASGMTFRTGGETRRNVTGYDLTSLLVGSEGTLAVITEITLKLLPKPPARLTALLAFEKPVDAGAAVTAISGRGIIPAALEIMDGITIDCVERYRPGHLPRDAAAVLLIEVDGEAESVRHELQRAVKAGEACGGRLVRSARTPEEAEELWESRRSISPALGRIAPTRIGEDISVPRTRVPEMLERIQKISIKHDLIIAVFGHAGDGNLHPNILTDARDPEKMGRTEAAINEIFAAALEMGGTLSGEHGIGKAKSRFMEGSLPAETLALMKGIKDVFDPGGILNPGKIFPSGGAGPG
jgi:glycolate oxidase